MNVTDIQETTGQKSRGIAGPHQVALRALAMVLILTLFSISSISIAQEADAGGTPEGEVGAPEDEGEIEEDEEQTEGKLDPTDPRVLAREELERRERISRLSRNPVQLPTEGQSLTSSSVPLALQNRQGIQYGRALFSPSAFVGAIYTDNANNAEDNREDEVTLGGSASLRVDALRRRHALGADVNVTAGSSLIGNGDDVFGWQAGADGRYDLTRRSSFNAAVSGSLAQEADSSNQADDNDAKVNDYNAGVGYQFIGRRVNYSLSTSLSRSDFSGENTADRDVTTYNFAGQAIRSLSDRLAVFIAPQYSINVFDEVSAEDGLDRDSSEASAVVGVDYQPRPRLALGAAIGYSRTFFDASDVDDDGAIVGSLTAAYNYDARTDIALGVSRQLDITTADNAASGTTTTATASVTRLLSSVQAVTTNASYTNTDFNDGARIDHDLSAGVSYFHQLNPNLVFNVGYQFSTRFSDVDNSDFYENQISVGLSVTY